MKPKQTTNAQAVGCSDLFCLILTAEQMETISHACNVAFRLGLGQYTDALECLPLKKEMDWSQWHDDKDAVGKMLSKHTVDGVDGICRSHGISSPVVSNKAKVACDIHQTIRHHLSWRGAVKDGTVKSMSSKRKWPEMMTVNYDEPMIYGNQPKPKILLQNAKGMPTPINTNRD